MEVPSILVVDDDVDILELTDFFFTSAGMEVECARNGEEALKKLLARSFSAIITDYNMPGMNGVELAGKIRDTTSSPPVILITGKPSAELAELATTHGIKSIVPKPLNLDKLLELIKEMTPSIS